MREDALASQVNSDGLWMHKLPYQAVRWTAIISGVVSLPLVFEIRTAKAFNDYLVTMEVPLPTSGELDTVLEVGSWTWNWMEPPLGTISFYLLCMQVLAPRPAALHSARPPLNAATLRVPTRGARFPRPIRPLATAAR